MIGGLRSGGGKGRALLDALKGVVGSTVEAASGHDPLADPLAGGVLSDPLVASQIPAETNPVEPGTGCVCAGTDADGAGDHHGPQALAPKDHSTLVGPGVRVAPFPSVSGAVKGTTLSKY